MMTIHEWRQVPTLRKHQPKVDGGRCGFASGRRPDGLCGRVPSAGYLNQHGPGIAWRCVAHDKDVVVAAAARLGYVRQAVES